MKAKKIRALIRQMINGSQIKAQNGLKSEIPGRLQPGGQAEQPDLPSHLTESILRQRAEGDFRDTMLANLRSKAVLWADTLVFSGVVFPCENQRPDEDGNSSDSIGALASVYFQCSVDDLNNPLSEGSRVEMLTRIYGSRLSHGLLKDSFDSDQNRKLTGYVS